MLILVTHLQCTTTGPAFGMLFCLSSISWRNPKAGPGLSGTPWSGHVVKWNWYTFRLSFEWPWMDWCVFLHD